MEKYLKNINDKEILEAKIENLFEEQIDIFLKTKKEKMDFFKNYLIYEKGNGIKTETKVLYKEFSSILIEKLEEVDDEEKQKNILFELIVVLSRQINLLKFFERYQPNNFSSKFSLSFFLIKKKLTRTFFPLVFSFVLKNNLFDE